MLSIGARFYSFEDLSRVLEQFQQENKVQLWVRDSRTVHAAAKRVKRSPRKNINPLLKYAELTYACIYGGRTHKTGRKIQSNNGCPFRLRISSSIDGQALIVKEVCLDHNHDPLEGTTSKANVCMKESHLTADSPSSMDLKYTLANSTSIAENVPVLTPTLETNSYFITEPDILTSLHTTTQKSPLSSTTSPTDNTINLSLSSSPTDTAYNRAIKLPLNTMSLSSLRLNKSPFRHLQLHNQQQRAKIQQRIEKRKMSHHLAANNFEEEESLPNKHLMLPPKSKSNLLNCKKYVEWYVAKPFPHTIKMQAKSQQSNTHTGSVPSSIEDATTDIYNDKEKFKKKNVNREIMENTDIMARKNLIENECPKIKKEGETIKEIDEGIIGDEIDESALENEITEEIIKEEINEDIVKEEIEESFMEEEFYLNMLEEDNEYSKLKHIKQEKLVENYHLEYVKLFDKNLITPSKAPFDNLGPHESNYPHSQKDDLQISKDPLSLDLHDSSMCADTLFSQSDILNKDAMLHSEDVMDSLNLDEEIFVLEESHVENELNKNPVKNKRDHKYTFSPPKSVNKKKNKRAKYICPSCHLPCKRGQAAIQCPSCKEWTHYTLRCSGQKYNARRMFPLIFRCQKCLNTIKQRFPPPEHTNDICNEQLLNEAPSSTLSNIPPFNEVLNPCNMSSESSDNAETPIDDENNTIKHLETSDSTDLTIDDANNIESCISIPESTGSSNTDSLLIDPLFDIPTLSKELNNILMSSQASDINLIPSEALNSLASEPYDNIVNCTETLNCSTVASEALTIISTPFDSSNDT